MPLDNLAFHYHSLNCSFRSKYSTKHELKLYAKIVYSFFAQEFHAQRSHIDLQTHPKF